jgi:hypothetical protein
MAIQDLEVIVTVDVQKALASLRELRESLDSVARSIDNVDRRGARGISINTHIESIHDDLGRLSGDIMTWEARNKINIRTDTDDLDLRNLDDIVIRREGGGGGVGGDDVATMNVDAGVVNIDGLNLQGLEDTLRNAFRGAFGDLGSEDGVFISISGIGDDDEDDDDERVGLRRRMRQASLDLRDGNIRLTQAVGEVTDELGDMAANSKLTNLSMSDIHNAFARLVPLLITFLGTVPALIGAFVTLYAAAITAAGALAALTGLAAIGFAMDDGTTNINTERLQEALSDVRQDFLEAFAPIAERLEPLFRDGLDGLERFFNALAQEGDALIALTDEARAFGGFLIDFIPSALRDLAALVSALSDEFGGIGRFLQQNFTRIIRGMVETTVQALPAISQMLQLIASMIPPLIRMSIGFVKVTSGILAFIGAIGDALRFLNIGSETVGFVIASLLTLVSATLLATGAFKVLGLSILQAAIRPMTLYITNALVAAGASYSLAAALATVLSIITLGAFAVLATGILSVGASAMSAKSDVDKLNSSLRNFDRLSSGMSTNIGTDVSDGPSGISGSGGGGGSGGLSMTYVDEGGNGNPDEAGAYSQWRYGRTTGDKA